jgi:8-oxo-dGTP pyrophosphatase MutT (NUDIX family)
MDLVEAATFGGDERSIPQYRADGDPTVRLAGRVIVLDPANRVLLFRYDDPLPFGVHWATPGGGLDPGEDFHAGALRELREETGWTDVPVGSAEVLRHDRPLMRGAQVRRQHERFFLARVAVPRRPVGDIDGMHASDGIAASHWWTLAELESTTEAILPPNLAAALRDLIG